MPKVSFNAAVAVAAGVATLASFGCASQRRTPIVVVEAEYSYLRDGGMIVDAGATTPGFASGVELAEGGDADLPVEMREPSLIRPARSLVQVDGAVEARP